MPLGKQLTGMRGVYLVAAELSKRGYIASPTSRGAIGADILATDQECRRAYSVQVKTNAKTFGFWLLTEKARSTASRSHVYAFVNIRVRKEVEKVEIFLVPSMVVARKMVSGSNSARKWSEWHQFNLVDAQPYLEKWAVFGMPSKPTLPYVQHGHPARKRAGSG